MVKIIEKNSYYYFQYSFKDNGKQVTYEKYLGKKLPINVLLLQEEFSEEVFEKRFGKRINEIVKDFREENKNLNKVAKKKYLSQFAIKFTYNSQAIEGSTLSLKDTAMLIEHGFAPAKKLEDIKLSKTHYDVFFEILDERKDLSYDLILDWHRRLFEDTYPQMAGKLRAHSVRVVGSKSIFTHPEKVKFELREFIIWYNKNKNKTNPLRLAALVHLKFVSIHPFTDGNGRMSRLLMNYVLYLNNYPLLDIDYSKRSSYYNALEKDQVNQTQTAFVDFIAKRFISYK